MLQAKEHSNADRKQYRKKVTGTLVHVYEVFGTEDELAEYAEAQGSNLRTDDDTGRPLFFTTRPFITSSGKLGISQSGTVYQDTSELDKIQSIVENAGGNFGDVLADKLLGNMLGGSIASEAPVKANKENAEDPGNF